jgi:hypothetical protein
MNRQSHIDDVRSLVILLVVLLHASVTYSGLGGWYVVENRADGIDLVTKVICGLFNSFNQAWFMGIMFFFGGRFAYDALRRKGPGAFIRDRLARLGIPLAGYVFVVNPLLMYFLAYHDEYGKMGGFFQLYFGAYIGKGMLAGSTGPLWFAEALLMFCAVLALAAKLVPSLRSPTAGEPHSGAAAGGKMPSTASLLALILCVAVAAFGLRIFWPIGTSWLNLQFCFFASYIALFALGVAGARGGWFDELTNGRRNRWLIVSFAVGIPAWACIMVFGGVLSGNMDSMNGGLTWQSAAYALWESFTAIGMSVGLTAAFANGAARRAEKKNGGADSSAQGAREKISRFLAANSFSVFVFHPVFLVGLTKLLHAWALHPAAKALVVGSLAYASSLAFAGIVVRRVPWVKKYF